MQHEAVDPLELVMIHQYTYIHIYIYIYIICVYIILLSFTSIQPFDPEFYTKIHLVWLTGIHATCNREWIDVVVPSRLLLLPQEIIPHSIQNKTISTDTAITCSFRPQT
jgi:hypothetical protein